ncbi:hypothetical protein AcV7_003433 [Taiwanofungus camphoratus]|nr:hypothetical protein AcV7_003433 [Antrodia cinnamomea]
MSLASNSQPQPYVPAFPERDEHGGDDLPTYDDLAAQHGPNSRFGRWKQWIEKRAAERYADTTPEDLQRRRERGWGEGVGDPEQASPSTSAPAIPVIPTPALRLPHIQTDFSTSAIPVSPPFCPPALAPPATLIPEVLSPSRLNLYQFGSRFLPHATAPIRCLLPLLNDRLLLIGHDDGLSVLDMFPKEWSDDGLVEKGPADAEVRPIWEGEVVYQLSVLEAESTGQGTPQGVVLALVGPEIDYPKDQEGLRTLRMYNLASLVSLAKWAVAQKGSRPLSFRQCSSGKGSHSKKHRPQSSFTKGLKNLMIDSPIAQPQPPSHHNTEPQASYSAVADAPIAHKPLPLRPQERSDTDDSAWDIVDDLPLLWATHYTPLASAGSRLHNSSVLFYDLWRNENARSRGAALLAVATKSNIFLYEAPKGERAFHLIKEFYTPLTARSITFVQQSVQDTMSRSPSDVQPRSVASRNQRHARVVSLGSSHYPHQLSLFVIFEKKAGLIRIADSAVGEVELYDEFQQPLHVPSQNQTSPLARRSRASWDGRGFTKDHKAPWAPPVKMNLPSFPYRSPLVQSMYVLTRGKQSHIVPHPLPPSVSSIPPYRVLIWSSPPSHISCRVCSPSREGLGLPAFLQVVAFGGDGVEVQEISLSSLSERKGKRRDEVPSRAQSDLGGETGFLCLGGHWHQPSFQGLARSDSVESTESTGSLDNFSTEESTERLRTQQGIYGWVRKGLEDWRVFWVGGTGALQEDDNIL